MLVTGILIGVAGTYAVSAIVGLYAIAEAEAMGIHEDEQPEA